MSIKLKGIRANRNIEMHDEIIPAPYFLKIGESRFTFKNLFIEYARFHFD